MTKKAKRTVPFSGWLTKAQAEHLRCFMQDGESLGQVVRRLALSAAAAPLPRVVLSFAAAFRRRPTQTAQ